MTPSGVSSSWSRAYRSASLKSCYAAMAMQVVRALLKEESGTRQWSFIKNELQKAPATLALRPLKIALLSSFSTEFLHAPLIAYGFASGIRVEIYQAGFGQFRQEILDERSG